MSSFFRANFQLHKVDGGCVIPDYILKKLLEHADRNWKEAKNSPPVFKGVVAPKNHLAENVRDVTQAAVYMQEDLVALKTMIAELKAEVTKNKEEFLSEREGFHSERMIATFLVRLLAGVMALMGLYLIGMIIVLVLAIAFSLENP